MVNKPGNLTENNSGAGASRPKSVGVLTLEGNFNFGNVLQSFALQRSVQLLGVRTVEAVHGVPMGPTRFRIQKTRIENFIQNPSRYLKLIASRFIGPLDENRQSRGANIIHPDRSAQISRFVSERIAVSSARYFKDSRRDSFGSKYTFFVVGSDQVWNPAATNANSEWFLEFAEPEQRVAYAASISAPSIPRELRSKYRKGLRGIPQISVREHQGADIVEELIGRRPPVVLDPTMLHTADFWDELASKPASLENKNYVLFFHLKDGDDRSGGESVVLRRSNIVEEYATRNGLEIIDIYDPVDPQLLAIGPLEFIGAIRNARLVVTDSFHAAAFSTIFHTPFLLEERGNMNSRFETLLDHIGLNNRMLNEIVDVESALDVDWESVDERLADRRRDSLAFLAGALGLTPPGECK
ncbi:polysaccharide pyruvyl transferase family protein [Flaviflexus ciconiae]|nr:polysaccharide pyruvyl transferase family protein [Flaviflexus ciconiae]